MDNRPRTPFPSESLLEEASESTGLTRYGVFLPWLVLLLSLAATFLVWTVQERAVGRDARDYFDFRVDNTLDEMGNRLRLYKQALRGAQALFDASGSVDREEFSNYVSGLNLNAVYPGIQGIGFALVVKPAELKHHIESIRRQGFPDYTVKPAGKRGLYTSIIYLEPFDWRNQRAFGYDMYSQSVRRKAMEAARDTGQMAMSGKVVLVQETQKDVQSGFLIYLPVYKKGMPHATLEERRANLVGWVYSVFRMGDLMNGVFKDRSDEFDIHVYDGNAVSDNAMMYDYDPGFPPHPIFTSLRRVQIAGHEWTILVGSRPKMEARFNRAQPVWIAVGGVLISLLLALVTWMEVNGRRRALRLAVDLNHDLIESRKELEAENEKNLALLHNASDGIYILDVEGNIIEVSDSFCSMLGYGREEMIGMNISGWDVGFADPEALMEGLRRQFGNPSRYQFETRHVCKDGKIIDVEVSGISLELQGRQVLFKSSRDITERKRLLEDLRRESEKNQALLRNASDGIHILDVEGNVIEASDSFCDMLGYRRDEVIGMNVSRWEAKIEGPEALHAVLMNQFENPARSQFETLHRRKDGEIIEVEVSGYPLELEGRSVLFNSSRDITERKQLQKSLQEERDFMNAVLDSAGTMVMVIDRQGAIVRFNRAAEEFSGYSFAEVKNRPFFWRNFLVQEQRAGVEAVFESALSGDVRSNYENIWESRSGEQRFFNWTNTLLDDVEGRASFLVTIGNDITERKNLERQLIERERVFHAVFDQTPNAIELIDPRTLRFVEANPAACRMLGYTHEEFLELRLTDTQVDLDEAALQAAVRGIGESGGLTLENRHRCKNGEILDVEITSKMLELPDRQLLVGLWRDITESKRAEKALLITSSVFDNSQEGILITDADNAILDVNPAFTSITGYEKEEVLGRTPRLLSSGRQDKAFYDAMWRSLKEDGVWRGEIWNRRKSGEIYAELLSISVIRDNEGRALRHVGVFSDINYLKKHEAELSRIAHYDALTGIPNRALLADRMKQAIAQTRRENNMMAVCYLDLDGFKAVNDTMGHEAGDEVLVGVAGRIMGTIRGGDTVARLGGDEFVVLLLGLEKGEECMVTLGRLLEAIADPFEIKGKSFSLGASIGVSIYPLDDEDADTLLRHADQAMYQAKQSGKNRFDIYDPSLDLRARDHREFVKSIRQALENEEFELFYQPKVNLKSRRMVGAEALLRWRHSERGLLSPAEFLHLVENSALDVDIGEWVVETALAQMRKWRAVDLDIEVSINISAYHLESEGFVEMLGEKLGQYPDVPPNKLQIEVLETAALADVATVNGVIQACRKFGVGFALDDFGTGYSSLTYLSRLPVDALKIDQSFIKGMLNDKGDMAIVHGIVALARVFGRQTVAEGVETEAHYSALVEMDCEMGQGYGIAYPMTADEMADWRMT